jgi:hypothetical protein
VSLAGLCLPGLSLEVFMNKLKTIIWAVRNEPKRVWFWWHQKDLITGKRFSFYNACRAVCENPPCFDMMWNYYKEEE